MRQSDINSIVLFLSLLIGFGIIRRIALKLRAITKKQNLHQYLNTQARLRSIEFAPSAFITIDASGRIVAWNGGAYTLFGYTEHEMLGKGLSLIIPERFREAHKKGLERVTLTGQSKRLGQTMEMVGMNKAKIEFPVRITLWRWLEGADVFYTGILRDVSIEKDLEVKNDFKLEIYKRGEEINESGTWSWDVLNDKVTTTEGFNKIFDIDISEEVDSGYLLRRVYHEDLKKVEAAIKTAFDNKEGYIISYRVVARNGTHIPVTVTAEAYLDKNDELINITGTIRKDNLKV